MRAEFVRRQFNNFLIDRELCKLIVEFKFLKYF